MTVEENIKEALLKQGKIVVTGLGTFSAEEHHAEIGDEGEIIAPPSTKISFTSDVVELGEYSILDYISRKAGLEPLDVEQRVISFVKGIKEEIADHDYAELPGLGIVKKGLYGDFTFEMYDGLNLKPDSYGLPKLEARPISKETPAKIERARAAAKKDTNLTLWAILIPVIILMVVGAYIFIDDDAYNALFGKDPIAQNETPRQTATPQKVQPVDTDKDEATQPKSEPTEKKQEVKQATTPKADEKKAAEQKQQAQQTTDQKASDSEQQKQTTTTATTNPVKGDIVHGPNNRFYIILGSFSTLANAKEGLAKTKGKGYDNAKVISSGGKFRLSANDFNNRRDADGALSGARKDYPGAWVFKF